MGLGDVLSTAGRVGLGITTGGLSEAIPAANNLLNGSGSDIPISQAERQRQDALNKADALRKTQANLTNTYRDRLSGTQAEMGNQAEEQSRRNLAQSMSGIDQAANQRGLLYSGLRAGSQAGARAQEAQNLSQQKANIYDQTNQQAEQLDTGAINAGYQQQTAQQKASDDAYQAALAKMQSGQGVTNALLNAGGAVAGKAIASQR